jgi:hypothetical protein
MRPMSPENIPEVAIDYENRLTYYATDWQERIRGGVGVRNGCQEIVRRHKTVGLCPSCRPSGKFELI